MTAKLVALLEGGRYDGGQVTYEPLSGPDGRCSVICITRSKAPASKAVVPTTIEGIEAWVDRPPPPKQGVDAVYHLCRDGVYRPQHLKHLRGG